MKKQFVLCGLLCCREKYKREDLCLVIRILVHSAPQTYTNVWPYTQYMTYTYRHGDWRERCVGVWTMGRKQARFLYYIY